jgi:hypothetical protein
MIYKTVSSKYLRGTLLNDYSIEFSDWKNRAMEWINQGVGLMDIKMQTEQHSEAGVVDNYICELPCDLLVLSGIEYQGYRLPSSNYINVVDDTTLTNRSNPTEQYTLNNNGYIHTTFESGDIMFHYRRFPADADGYILIPDVPIVIEYMCKYLILKLVAKYGKIGAFDNYDKLEAQVLGMSNPNPSALRFQARNACGTPDADTHQKWNNLRTGIISNRFAWYNTFFVGNDSK